MKERISAFHYDSESFGTIKNYFYNGNKRIKVPYDHLKLFSVVSIGFLRLYFD